MAGFLFTEPCLLLGILSTQGSRKTGWMESYLLKETESIPTTVFLPFEPDLLKVAEISTASESHLLNGAELFLTV